MIIGGLNECRGRAHIPALRTVKGARRVVASIAELNPPARQGGIRPVRTLVGMALVTGIGAARTHREIRPRDAHAVVAAVIHTHVGLRGHMTVDTSAPRGRLLMSMMGGVVVGARQMTLGTHAIAFHHQLIAVRVMTVTAHHPRLMHLALDERTVNVHLDRKSVV